MEDYQANSRKSKEEPADVGKDKPKKKVEKAVTGEVLVHKKTLGEKFKETFIGADAKSVVMYVAFDVLIPAVRNMIVDVTQKGIERMVYGDRGRRGYLPGPGNGPRYQYNSPVSRAYDGGPLGRSNPLSQTRSSPSSQSRYNRAEVVLGVRDDAVVVLERLNDCIDQYDVASVADLYELVGWQSSHIDHKWGWTNLRDVQIQQVREGFLINLPQPEPIQ